jgi:uncharacterized protein YyaL (SSP411 family)
VNAAIDRLTELALQAAAEEDEPLGPTPLTLLLRRYSATGREDIGAALGRGLARALEELALIDQGDPAGWAALFVEASEISDDERLPGAIAALASRLRREWPSRGSVAAAMRSVDACLMAAQGANAPPEARDLIAAAVDEMERVVAGAYQPGEALAHRIGSGDADGELRDHVDAASALLTAHAVTGRLPYSMLAEELIQFAWRTWWDSSRGTWKSQAASRESQAASQESRVASQESQVASRETEEFVTGCAAARVLCRLAWLHRDDEYRRAAVIAGQCDYEHDAERTLTSLSSSYRELGIGAAIYAIALGEWRALGER